MIKIGTNPICRVVSIDAANENVGYLGGIASAMSSSMVAILM